MMHKIALVRRPAETSFRAIHWHLICFHADRLALVLQRPASVSSGFSSVSITGGDAKPVYFAYSPTKASGQEQWVLRMPRDAIKSLLNSAHVDLTENSRAAGERLLPNAIKLSNEGFAPAMDNLTATCPPAKDSAVPQAVGLPNNDVP